MLNTVQKELKTNKARRELSCFVIAHEHMQREFKDLCLDEKALNDAIAILHNLGYFSLVKRLERISGREYY